MINGHVHLAWLGTSAYVAKHLFVQAVPIATGPAFRAILATAIVAGIIESVLSDDLSYRLYDRYIGTSPSAFTGKSVVVYTVTPFMTLLILEKISSLSFLLPAASSLLGVAIVGVIALGVLLRFKPATVDLFNRDVQNVNWDAILVRHRQSALLIASPNRLITLTTYPQDAFKPVNLKCLNQLRRDIGKFLQEVSPIDHAIISEVSDLFKESTERVATAGNLRINNIQMRPEVEISNNGNLYTIKRTYRMILDTPSSILREWIICKGSFSLVYQVSLEQMMTQEVLLPTKLEVSQEVWKGSEEI
jgi:hypothetical protein